MIKRYVTLSLVITLAFGGIFYGLKTYGGLNVNTSGITGTLQPNTSPTTSLTSGLIGYWTFDGKDTTGTPASNFTALDRSGSNYTFATTSFPLKIPIAPQVKQGIFGQAYEFNGRDSGTNYVAAGLYTIGTNLSTTNGTVCEWLFPYAYQTVDSGSRGNLFEGWNGTNDLIFFNAGTTGLIKVREGADTITSASSIALRSWSLVCFTWNGTAYKIYINGVEDASGGDGTMGGALRNDWNIGKAINGTISSFNGLMDDVRIYNRALSASEMKQLYKLPQTVSPNVSPINDLTNGLVGYWTFDGQDMLSNIRDRSGNSNNAVLVGSTATSTFQASGVHGQAIRFDGATTYATAPDSSTLDQDGSFSVSLWIRPENFTNTYNTLVYKGAFGGDENYFISTTSGGEIYFEYRRTGGYDGFTSSGAGLTVNNWKHITVTFEDLATNNIKIYVDGVSVLSSTSANEPLVDNSPLLIGTDYDTREYKGVEDDLRVYNRALSATEVNQLYRLGR